MSEARIKAAFVPAPYALVAAAPAGGDALAPALLALIGGQGEVRVLSAGGAVAAAEAVFHAASAGQCADIAAAAQSLPADTALLPAANRRKRLLISDMDATIIGQECLDELAAFAGLKSEIAAITEAAMRGELDFEAALTRRVAMLKGLPLGALQQTLDTAITLNPGAATLVATMKAHGARTVLVSGGFTFFTSAIAARAGFDHHHGNTLGDDGDRLTGTVARPILGRAEKRAFLDVHAAALGLARADTLALGDGANDLGMIEAAGLGIAYRAKPRVAAAAHAAITLTDLTTVLYFQGYSDADFARA
jgi:phosphoserine phosphatase